MPTMYDWKIKRSGAGLVVIGTYHAGQPDDDLFQNYKLTGVTSVECTAIGGQIVARIGFGNAFVKLSTVPFGKRGTE
jgi:hypothetical protein